MKSAIFAQGFASLVSWVEKYRSRFHRAHEFSVTVEHGWSKPQTYDTFKSKEEAMACVQEVEKGVWAHSAKLKVKRYGICLYAVFDEGWFN